MIISPGNFAVPNIAGADLAQGSDKAGSLNEAALPGKGVIQTVESLANNPANVVTPDNTVDVSKISSPQLASNLKADNGSAKTIPFRSGPQDVAPQTAAKKGIDTVTLSNPQPSTPSSLIANQYSGFEGSDYPASCYCTPPDGNLAVGPNHIFETVNLEGKIWSKSGTPLSTFSTTSFFGTGSLFTSDPRIVYDAQSDRWFAIILATDTTHNGYVKVAVSQTANPTGAWWIYTLTFANVVPDQPRIGVTDDKVTIVASNYPWVGGWTGEQMYILNKSQMIVGGSTNYVTTGPDVTRFHVEPALYPVGGQTDQWLVQAGAGGATGAEYLKIDGLPGVSAVHYTSMFVTPIAATTNPPSADQPGTATNVATNDARITSASMRGGIISWTANDGCGNSCIRWDIASTAGTLLQDKEVSLPGKSLYFAAVSQDAPGSFGLIFDFSSATDYPSIGFTGQSNAEPYGTVNTPVLVKAGTGPDTTGRHGDFHAVRADPFTAGTYYGMAEYNTAGLPWNTFVSVNSISSSTFSRHVTGLTLNSIANVPWGAGIAVTGKLVDLSASSIGIGNEPITFTTSSGTVLSTVTNPDGTFSATGTSPGAPPVANINVQASYAGTQFFQPSNSAVKLYSTTKHNVSLVQSSLPNVLYGRPFTLVATLSDLSLNNAPVSSKTISWSGNGTAGSPSAITDPQGNAELFTVVPKVKAGLWQVQASFAGDSNYNSATSSIVTYSTIIHSVRVLLWTPLNVTKSSTATFGATLVDGNNGAPMAGQVVSFSGTGILGGPKTGTTNSNGDVIITDTAPSTVGTWNVKASFGGIPFKYSPATSVTKSYHTS